MIRRIAIVLLILASIGTLVLTAVSYSRTPPRDAPYWPPNSCAPKDFSPDRRYSLYLSARRGKLSITRNTKYCLQCGRLPPNHAPGCFHRLGTVTYVLRPLVEHTLRFPGVRWITWTNFAIRSTELTISLWLVFAVFAVYPFAAFVRGPIRRHRRRKRGLCLTCGYDLTGNESGRCPECGESVGDS